MWSEFFLLIPKVGSNSKCRVRIKPTLENKVAEQRSRLLFKGLCNEISIAVIPPPSYLQVHRSHLPLVNHRFVIFWAAYRIDGGKSFLKERVSPNIWSFEPDRRFPRPEGQARWVHHFVFLPARLAINYHDLLRSMVCCWLCSHTQAKPNESPARQAKPIPKPVTKRARANSTVGPTKGAEISTPCFGGATVCKSQIFLNK